MKILKRISYLACSVATAATMTAAPAQAQTDPFIGSIMYFGGNFCPRGWADASGQLIAISTNQTLFSLLGTAYGGDGRTTFALPDLRGRAPMHIGNGPGLTPVAQGQKTGSETFTITSANQLPSHNHMVNATNAVANKNGPGTDFLSVPTDPTLNIYHEGAPTAQQERQMDPGMIAPTGASAPISHIGPGLGVRACIALQGIYPSRN
jgi:microcystin-dependent protein